MHRNAEEAFDAFAPHYDEVVGEHVSARRAKSRALREMRRWSEPGDHALDVGCGTGSEAMTLARLERHVTGIDLSGGMLEQARSRLRDAPDGITGRIVLRKAAARDADPSWLPAGVERFDLAYSIYGVLNLEPDPGEALRRVGDLVRPGGHVIVGLLNPVVLHELLAYPLLGRFKGYRKAARPRVELKVGRDRTEGVQCVLPTVSSMVQDAREGGLDLVRCEGIHLLSPPPTSGMVDRLRALVQVMNRFEDRVGTRWPWNRLGYFSLLTFRRDPR